MERLADEELILPIDPVITIEKVKLAMGVRRSALLLRLSKNLMIIKFTLK